MQGQTRGARESGGGEGDAVQHAVPSGSSPPLAPRRREHRDAPSSWSAVPLDAEAVRQLARRRIGYFGAVFLALSSAFYLRNAIAIGLLEHVWPPLGHPMFLLHTGAIAVHAAEWVL